jgi:hypothetical protein
MPICYNRPSPIPCRSISHRSPVILVKGGGITKAKGRIGRRCRREPSPRIWTRNADKLRFWTGTADVDSDITRRLRRWASSFTVKRPAAMRSGTNLQLNVYTTIPDHPGDMPEGTLRAILKQAGIEPDVFLKK